MMARWYGCVVSSQRSRTRRPPISAFSVRDVLDKLDLIISRRKDESWLLTGIHQYRIETQ